MYISHQDLCDLVYSRLRSRERQQLLPLKVVAWFCEVPLETVKGWLDHQAALSPTMLIRLWQLLADAGVPSPEVETMDRFNRALAKVFAFQAFAPRADPLSEIRFLCDLPADDSVTPYEILRGKQVVYAEQVYYHLVESSGSAFKKRQFELAAEIDEAWLEARGGLSTIE